MQATAKVHELNDFVERLTIRITPTNLVFIFADELCCFLPPFYFS